MANIELIALCVEARRRKISYGQLMVITSEEDRKKSWKPIKRKSLPLLKWACSVLPVRRGQRRGSFIYNKERARVPIRGP